MRIPPAEYLGLDLRAHALLRDVPLYDVTVVDLPGGGAGRTLADIRTLQAAAPPSHLANAIYGVRRAMGRALGWDRTRFRREDSILPRLSDQDRRSSRVEPGTPDGPFLILYQFPREALAETSNATVHGWMCTALTPT